ncbi:MAG: beta-lactamase regulating signal transducer with metallopeptidase domain [Planctomycetota bacterium]
MIAFSLEELDDMLLPLAGWLGTFALHSTIALGLTCWLVRMRRQRSLGLQDIMLRQAMWLPFFSSTLQYLVFGSMWDGLMAQPVVTADELAPMASMLLAEGQANNLVAMEAIPGTPWATIVVGIATSCSLLGFAWLWRMWRRLTSILETRCPETDPRVLSSAATMATHLGLRQSPHISRAQGLSTPIAFGFLRPEICLPARAAALDDASLRAMLGHELAHLRRSDPVWMWLGAWIHALFPWQILLASTRREWSRVVELRCDAEAAHHTSPTAVARCLIEVAEWLRPQTAPTTIALGMAARPSALRERVEAALGCSESAPTKRFAAGGVAALSLATMTMAAPGISDQVVTALTADEFRVAFTGQTPAAAERLQPFVALVEQEYGALVIEARALQANLKASLLPQPQLEELQSRLQLRLTRLSQLRARLLARVSRDSSLNR